MNRAVATVAATENDPGQLLTGRRLLVWVARVVFQYGIVAPLAAIALVISLALVWIAKAPRLGGGFATIVLLCVPVIGWLLLAHGRYVGQFDRRQAKQHARAERRRALRATVARFRPAFAPWG